MTPTLTEWEALQREKELTVSAAGSTLVDSKGQIQSGREVIYIISIARVGKPFDWGRLVK